MVFEMRRFSQSASSGAGESFIFILLAIIFAYGLRMLEWPCWQNPEYRLGNEMLLATHDAYHWVAGACGFGLATGHPMSVMLKWLADALNASPAQVAFWFPAVLASLVAGVVCLWVVILGGRETGIAAGLIASIAPGFLGRTLLGYYDTDLITLFFPLLITIGPACWVRRYIFARYRICNGKIGNVKNVKVIHEGFLNSEKTENTCKTQDKAIREDIFSNIYLDWRWICILAVFGIISFWTQQWHSVFPYLVRYNVLLLAAMCLLAAPKGRKLIFLSISFAYSFPATAGLPGLIYPIFLLACRTKCDGIILNKTPRLVFLLLVCLLALYLVLRGDILNTILNHINAYLKNSGDTHASGGVPLVFPSVAQSIIEVQDLSIAALFPYFHPWLEASLFGLVGFALVLFKRPAALFLLPLAALALSSSKLGGRMVMFGAPIVAIGIAFPFFWFGAWSLQRFASIRASGRICCILLCAILVAPFMDMIPALSQGPIINRRHAAALAQARDIIPADAILWLWWDWGYAAHYFARRTTIADGAQHSGPSLYLPAAVFATENARFARQVISHTSKVGNEPGNFFKGMGAEDAQELVNRLRSAETPLVSGKGRQYLVVSFEMLKLGFWISNYGNWNFVTCQSEGGALSIVPQALAYRIKTGEVRVEGSESIIFPTSITVFAETGITKKNYVQEWFESHPKATAAQQRALLESRRNINFLFNRVTDEKLAMDEGIYNSLMVQLLICDPNDTRFSPYFRLVYDNVFARIYEVVPFGEEKI